MQITLKVQHCIGWVHILYKVHPVRTFQDKGSVNLFLECPLSGSYTTIFSIVASFLVTWRRESLTRIIIFKTLTSRRHLVKRTWQHHLHIASKNVKSPDYSQVWGATVFGSEAKSEIEAKQWVRLFCLKRKRNRSHFALFCLEAKNIF